MNSKAVYWLYGLSGSGKSTIADLVTKELRDEGYSIMRLDGDNMRDMFGNSFGFTKEERMKHLKIAAKIARAGSEHSIVIATFITPYKEARELIRGYMGGVNYYPVFVSCSIEKCIKRDPKGLYKKALEGKIKNFTGIDDLFEAPSTESVSIDTESKNIEECKKYLIKYIKAGLS